MYLNFTINAGANALKMFRNIKEQSNISIIKLPDPNYTKRARVKMPWPDEEKENTQNLIDLTVTNLYPNVEAVKNPQTEAQIRMLANADNYGNLKAKSYLRLALQEPIIPNTVYEVSELDKLENQKAEEIIIESKASIFPNPTQTNILNVNLPNSINQGKLEIYNNLGQQVLKINLKQTSQAINLPEVNSGVYFLKISYFKGNQLISETEKLILTNE